MQRKNEMCVYMGSPEYIQENLNTKLVKRSKVIVFFLKLYFRSWTIFDICAGNGNVERTGRTKFTLAALKESQYIKNIPEKVKARRDRTKIAVTKSSHNKYPVAASVSSPFSCLD